MHYIEIDGAELHPPAEGRVLVTRTEHKAILAGRTPDGWSIVAAQAERRASVRPSSLPPCGSGAVSGMVPDGGASTVDGTGALRSVPSPWALVPGLDAGRGAL